VGLTVVVRSVVVELKFGVGDVSWLKIVVVEEPPPKRNAGRDRLVNVLDSI
jgi:hypothetical protein